MDFNDVGTSEEKIMLITISDNFAIVNYLDI